MISSMAHLLFTAISLSSLSLSLCTLGHGSPSTSLGAEGSGGGDGAYDVVIPNSDILVFPSCSQQPPVLNALVASLESCVGTPSGQGCAEALECAPGFEPFGGRPLCVAGTWAVLPACLPIPGGHKTVEVCGESSQASSCTTSASHLNKANATAAVACCRSLKNSFDHSSSFERTDCVSSFSHAYRGARDGRSRAHTTSSGEGGDWSRGNASGEDDECFPESLTIVEAEEFCEALGRGGGAWRLCSAEEVGEGVCCDGEHQLLDSNSESHDSDSERRSREKCHENVPVWTSDECMPPTPQPTAAPSPLPTSLPSPVPTFEPVCNDVYAPGWFADGDCCTAESPCREGNGDCDSDIQCDGTLVCGSNNCNSFGSPAQFAGDWDCCIAPSTPNPSSATTSNVVIDYSADLGPSEQVASGLLHGLDAALPAQYLIDGIAVRSIRGADRCCFVPSYFDEAVYERSKATGAELMIGVYYYVSGENNTYWPGDNGNWSHWENIVQSVYNEAQDKNFDVYSWITWNEPRLQWAQVSVNRTIDRYFEAHCRAYKALKAIDPSARIQAPEDHKYDLVFFAEFLNYTRENDCIPDVFAWHELRNEPLDIEGHSRELSQWLFNNSFEPIEFAVTEYQGQNYNPEDEGNTVPGVATFYIASMERAVQYGFKWGLRSAWTKVGTNADFTATLADMADANTSSIPRGLWWVYNAYRDMSGVKVNFTIPDATQLQGDGFASTDAGMLRSVIMAGTRNYLTPHNFTFELVNMPAYLQTNGKVNVRADLIRNGAWSMSPEVVIARDYDVVDDSIFIDLPTMSGKSSWSIYVTPATDDVLALQYETEDLATSFSNGKTHAVVADADASGGNFTVLEATEVGDFVEYTVPSLEAGVYHLSAVLQSGSSHGFMQLYVNGKAIGGPEDEWSAAGEQDDFYVNDFGNLEIGEGDLVLRFEVVGKHPYSDGFTVVFDRFDLKRLR